MTNKISIQFNEIEGQHLEVIKKLVKKPYDQLSQEDLIDIRTIINCYRDLTWQDDEQYQIINKLLNITLDSQLYRPMDQHSFIEYVINIMYDWVQENIDYGTSTFKAYDAFQCYYADGTITYNTQKTLNYIRAFWNDFHEDDLENFETNFVFDRPEAFFVQQCYYMAERVLDTIFPDSQEEYNKQDFLDYVDNEFDAYELDKLIY